MSAHATPEALYRDAQVTEAPVLSALEWKVVSLAIREAETAGCGGIALPPTRFRRAMAAIGAFLFGWQPAMPLADERLEMLRRFVCAVRRDMRRAETLARKLIDLGFSQAQIGTVKRMAAR